MSRDVCSKVLPGRAPKSAFRTPYGTQSRLCGTYDAGALLPQIILYYIILYYIILYFEGVKLPQGCPAEARLCAIGGPKCRFWRPGRQHFGAYVSTHIAIFAQNCSGKLREPFWAQKDAQTLCTTMFPVFLNFGSTSLAKTLSATF